jgi:hypothetical protein
MRRATARMWTADREALQMGLHLPNCIRCDAAQRLVKTIALGQRPGIQILECSNCRRFEMYFVINGALRRW